MPVGMLAKRHWEIGTYKSNWVVGVVAFELEKVRLGWVGFGSKEEGGRLANLQLYMPEYWGINSCASPRPWLFHPRAASSFLSTLTRG